MLAVVGCVPQLPLVIDSKYTPPQKQGAPRTPLKQDRNCVVSIESLIDKRSDTSTLGTVTGRSVRSPTDVGLWLRDTFKALDTLGVAVSDDNASSKQTIGLDAELVTAWVSDLPSSKNANIVLRVAYHQGDKVGEPKLYRGAASRMNWNAGDNELQRLIDAALTEILQNVSADVQSLCKQG